MKRKIAWFYVLLFTLTTSISMAVVIDFEDLSSPGSDSVSIGTEYEKDGFVFTAINSGVGEPPPIEFFYLEQDHHCFKGSTGIYLASCGNLTKLTRKENGLFDIDSIDLAFGVFNDDPLIETRTFKAKKSENQYVYHTVWLDTQIHFSAFTTFHFPESFQEIYSLEWVQGGFWDTFDNVTVAVPEPATMSLLALGSLALIRKQK